MPSFIRRVHSVLYPGWSTPERNATARNIKSLRKTEGRGARATIKANYTKAVLAARKQKSALTKKTKAGTSVKKPASFGIVHKPTKTARRAGIKRLLGNVK